MSNTGPETVDCENCGTEIRLTASVCHNCGADNVQRPGRSISIGHDPTNMETTVSDSWYYGVAAGTGLWVFSVLLTESAGAFADIIIFVAWIGLPLAAYFDMKYIRANSGWNPNTLLWIVGLAIPVLNIFLGSYFLYQRRDWMGVP